MLYIYNYLDYVLKKKKKIIFYSIIKIYKIDK